VTLILELGGATAVSHSSHIGYSVSSASSSQHRYSIRGAAAGRTEATSTQLSAIQSKRSGSFCPFNCASVKTAPTSPVSSRTGVQTSKVGTLRPTTHIDGEILLAGVSFHERGTQYMLLSFSFSLSCHSRLLAKTITAKRPISGSPGYVETKYIH
jgi:hypothetical protein